MATPREETKDTPTAQPTRVRPWIAPLVWVGAGAALTLSIVLVLRATESAPRASSSAPRASSAPPASLSLGRAEEEFAALYLSYLLKSYYVDERGFCPNLLRAICAALVTTDLIANERGCASLPNADLVLAIGRFQHGVGLPVDGKAGPETVRMILGGDFGSRRDMSNRYCPGPTSPSGSAAPSAP